MAHSHFPNLSGIVEKYLTVPSVLSVSILIWFLVDNYAIRLPFILSYLGLPDFGGRYRGQMKSSHIHGDVLIEVDIKQTLSSIIVSLRTPTSCSESTAWVLQEEPANQFELSYIYFNIPNRINQTFSHHKGTATFRCNSGSGRAVVSMIGEYYTDTTRQNHGTIELTRVGNVLPN